MADQHIGDNSNAELNRRIDRRIDILDQVAEMNEELKGFKAEDKSDGFDEKCITDAVKLKRADAEKVLATLLYEEKRKLYRKAAGVPTDIETAQGNVREHVSEVPEPRPKKKRDGKVVPFKPDKGLN